MAWKSFPNNKALVCALLHASSGLGTVFANLFSTFIINPYDVLTTPNHIGTFRYFDVNISSNVPDFFTYLALGEFIIMIIALVLIKDEPAEKDRLNHKQTMRERTVEYGGLMRLALKST